MSEPDESLRQETRVAGVAAKLRLDAATASVLELFATMGVHAVLLKGPSLVGWLYPTSSAHYTDADILVRPGDEDGAYAALSALGFEQAMDDRAMPDWWREHGTEWHRKQDAVAVDLHRWLVGIGVAPEVAWPLLTHESDSITLGGGAVPVLGRPARLLHVVLHAAQHGTGKGGKSLQHLERALDVATDAEWNAAMDLAGQLHATEAFSAGLRLLPAGTERAERLGLPAGSSVDAALRATAPPPTALGFEQMAQADGLRRRIAIGFHKLFPPREFLVHWDPRAAQSRRLLLWARIRRPLWVLASTPSGLRAWSRARRSVRR